MAFRSRRVSIGTTPVMLTTNNAFAAEVLNDSLVTLYVGGPGVTVGSGYPVAAGAKLPERQVGNQGSGGSGLYGVVAAGSASVVVLENGT